MRYHAVGQTDIKVSEIGFGCWTMGGPNWSLADGSSCGWADVKEDEIRAGIRAGLDAGVTHFDNADAYGNGRAERMLRDCLRQLGPHPKDNARPDLIIATKIGWFRGTAPHAYTPYHIRRQCEQSLANLGVDQIDIYYFHNPYFAEPGREGNIDDAVGEMRRLVAEGKVRAVGMSAYTEDEFERTVPVVRPDVLQSRSNMIDDTMIRPGSRVQALMAAHDCTYVAFGPLGQGLLLDKFDPANPPRFVSGDYRSGKPEFSPNSLAGLKPKLASLKERFGSTVPDLSSVACRFVAAHERVCSVIPGFRNERQALCNVRAGADEPMSEEEVAFCREVFG